MKLVKVNQMETRTKKAVAVMGLCAVLPLVFSLGISQYPLSCFGAVVVGIIGVNECFGEQEPIGTMERDKAKATSCPSGA